MNNKRFRRLMDSVDPELLEEAKEPLRRSRKRFGSLAAMVACFVLLVGGVILYYFKVIKKKPKQKVPSYTDEYDMDDDDIWEKEV